MVNEALATFDSRTQDRLRDNILAACAERGVLWIANRAEQARPFADVAVMDKGRLVGRGTHDELAARGGPYADLMSGG